MTTKEVRIESGIPESSQRTEFQNATLQGTETVAYSIATYVDVPAGWSESDVAEYLATVLSRSIVPAIRYHVQIGPAETAAN